MIRRAAHFGQDTAGAVAIEFAVILPLLLSLSLGAFEVLSAVRSNMRLQSAAQTMAELVAVNSSVNASLITDFCAGAKLMLAPFDPTTLTVAVASVTNKAGAVAADWQDTTCGAAKAMGSPITLAGGTVASSGDTVIVVQSTYTYTSPLKFVLPTGIAMTQVAFARPRTNTTVIHN